MACVVQLVSAVWTARRKLATALDAVSMELVTTRQRSNFALLVDGVNTYGTAALLLRVCGKLDLVEQLGLQCVLLLTKIAHLVGLVLGLLASMLVIALLLLLIPCAVPASP